jgi:hypothetical protein
MVGLEGVLMSVLLLSMLLEVRLTVHAAIWNLESGI